jgi:hypothetical protein
MCLSAHFTNIRAILAEKFLVAVSLPVPYERVAKFEFAASAVPNAERTHSLVVEVVGARSNLVLVECKTDVVLAAAYQVYAQSVSSRTCM